jgi:hypothetical protein
MSKIFKRPMFRKGGPTNNGIMTGIVDRENHAVSDEMGVGGKSFRDEVQNRLDLIESVSGGTGLDDPLTQFLLQYGPSLAGTTGGGSTIGNIVLAAKEPTANLLKDVQAQKKLKTGVALEVLDSLKDEDIAPFIEKAKQIAEETGRPYKDVLNELYQTEIYRKEKSPAEAATEKFEIDMSSLISKKDLSGNALISTYGAEEVVNQINKVKKGEVPGVTFDQIDIDQPYLRRDTEIESTNPDTGVVTLVEGEGDDYINGSLIYDYRTNKWLRVQEDTLIPVGG